MLKCMVCAWRMCATCHNLETRGEPAPLPPELTHPATEYHDTETPDQDNTPLQRPLPGDEASWPTLERRRELAKKNMPNTITFIPQRKRDTFA